MFKRPRICCLDLDTFFVSVERVLDPSLEGQQVIVGGRPGQRGVVTACSYEVRVCGVRSGMSLTEAARRAPRAVYLPTRGGLYGGFWPRFYEGDLSEIDFEYRRDTSYEEIALYGELTYHFTDNFRQSVQRLANLGGDQFLATVRGGQRLPAPHCLERVLDARLAASGGTSNRRQLVVRRVVQT